jgi:mRNA export factor
VVGTAERHIQVYDLNNPSAPFKQLQSPLKYQTRTVAAFPDKSGYLVGSIEGRVAVQHVDDGEFIFIYIWAMFLTSCFI